jgi:hypothetical protein
MAGFRGWGSWGAVLVLVGTSCEKPTHAVPPERPVAAAPPPSADEEPVPEPEPPPPPALPEWKLESEVAWARSVWPEETAKLRFESLASELEKWVPANLEVAVYLLSTEHACVETILARFVPEPPDENTEVVEGNSDPTLEHQLTGKILTEKKATQRSFTVANFGHQFEIQSAFGSENLRAGKWQDGTMSAIGEPPRLLGILTHVDGEMAVFGGVPVTISVDCNGPDELWTCPSGGQRHCDSCRQSRLDVSEYNPWMSGMSSIGLSGVHAGATTCADPCPKHEPKDRARLRRLHENSVSFIDKAEPDAPKLFRTKKRCLSERTKRKKA